MKRRDVLKLGVVAAATSQLPLDEGCVVPRATTPVGVPDEFLTTLDKQLAATHGADFVRQFMHAETKTEPTPAQRAMLDDKDAMFRKMLRTLIITQGFRDQEPETQLAPAVQARMFDHMDEIGSTVYAVSDLLASLGDTHRTKLKQTLKARPDLPMSIAEAIDAQAARAGISNTRRLQLRQMMASATFRMRQGDPSSLIDEYVAKVARVRESGKTDAEALSLAQKMGERAFWKYQHLAQDAAGSAVPATAAPSGAPGMTDPSPMPARNPPTPGAAALPDRTHPGSRGLRAAGYMMGIGVVTFGVSAALVDTAAGFVVGMTVGALLFAAGFVTLIVSALIYWTE